MTSLLLDTHVLLWYDVSPERLPERIVRLVRDRRTRVFVSSVTAWELGIKHRAGKLPEAATLLERYADTLVRVGFLELPLTGAHALEAATLEHSHRDPFDRAIAAQARLEGLTVVTRDEVLPTLPGVATLWD